MCNLFNQCIMLCDRFQQGDFEIAEFQSRLNTMQIPDAVSREFCDNLHNIIEELEKIIYCYSDSQHKFYGYRIAEKLKQLAKAELKNQATNI